MHLFFNICIFLFRETTLQIVSHDFTQSWDTLLSLLRVCLFTFITIWNFSVAGKFEFEIELNWRIFEVKFELNLKDFDF